MEAEQRFRPTETVIRVEKIKDVSITDDSDGFLLRHAFASIEEKSFGDLAEVQRI